MKHNIEIISNGTAAGTFVFTDKCEPIKGVTSLEIEKLEYNGLVTAILTFKNVKLNMVATVTEKTFLQDVIDILEGIDSDTGEGWWDTSSGAELGRAKLNELIKLIAEQGNK